jgi:virginiamycin B lyase
VCRTASWLAAIGSAAVIFVSAMTHSRPAASQTAATLAGTVSSAEEGMMEGVLVSARKDGSTITTTVVSDNEGRYSFPAERLDPGHYGLSIRAVGYDLTGPKSVDLEAGKSAAADLNLVKTKRLAAQLSNAEWIASAPGTDRQRALLTNCVGCHTVQRVFMSTHDSAEFMGAAPAHGWLFAGHDAAQAAALGRPVPARLRPAPAGGGGLFCNHQPERGR